MRGHIDKLGPTGVAGWAVDPAAPSTPVTVRLTLGKKTLASVEAALDRPDVGAVMKSNGKHGFNFDEAAVSGVDEKDLKKLMVAALGADNKWVNITGERPKPQKASNPQYQSFEDVEGASKSFDKLKALQLSTLNNRANSETPLHGLSVLDLGCNEGFFCGEALRQGATRVVGIDANGHFINAARKRFPDAEFIQGSWWDIPNEKFDVIFFLSAIHYEWDQRKFLEKLATHLTENGTLVLECGIGPSVDSNWHVIHRHDGIMRYPNFATLSKELLAPFSWRYCGNSVQQSGDPVSRSVFHCQPKRPMALIVTGASGSGKTTLSLELQHQGYPVLRTDALIKSIIEHPRYDWSPLTGAIRNAYNGSAIDCMSIGNEIVKQGHAERFVDLILLEAFLENDLSVIEGEVLQHPEISSLLISRLKEKGIKTWTTTPG